MIDAARTGGLWLTLVTSILALAGVIVGALLNAHLTGRNLIMQQKHDRQMTADRWTREAAERRRAELQRAYTELLSSTGTLVPWSLNRIKPQQEDSGYLTAMATVTAALQAVVVVGSAEAATAASEMVQRLQAALKYPVFNEEVHGAYTRARDAYLAVIRREIAEEPRPHATASLPAGLHY